MLTLDTPVRAAKNVLFTGVAEEAVLLNTRSNKYFGLNDVGARFWDVLVKSSLRDAYQVLCSEFAVNPQQLEQDLLELADLMVQHDLLEII
jgi:Coenzyme PQQ synthesis protein D (PqqD)